MTKSFSAIIPLYNKEGFIAHALSSATRIPREVLHEIIVVDDGSTDAGPEIVERLMVDDDRIQLFRQENGGVSSARNTGVARASGSHILFLDADDEWTSEHVSEIARLADLFPSATLLATSFLFRDQDNRTWQKPAARRPAAPEEVVRDFFATQATDTAFFTSTTCVRRDAYAAVNGCPVGVSYGEDRILFARLAMEGDVVLSPVIGAYYSVGHDGQSFAGWTLEKGDAYSDELLRLLRRAAPAMRASIESAILEHRRSQFFNGIEKGQRIQAARHHLGFLLRHDTAVTTLTRTLPRLLMPTLILRAMRNLVRRRPALRSHPLTQ